MFTCLNPKKILAKMFLSAFTRERFASTADLWARQFQSQNTKLFPRIAMSARHAIRTILHTNPRVTKLVLWYSSQRVLPTWKHLRSTDVVSTKIDEWFDNCNARAHCNSASSLSFTAHWYGNDKKSMIDEIQNEVKINWVQKKRARSMQILL